MYLFHFIIIFHVVIYVFFSLSRTNPALYVLRNQLQRLGQLLVCAEGSLLHRMHNVMWLLKGALQSLLERGVLGWVNGSPCEQHSYISPIRRVDNVVFHPRFLRHSKMLLFYQWVVEPAWYCGCFVNRCLTASHKCCGLCIINAVLHGAKQDSQWELGMLGASRDMLSTFQYWALNNGLELKQHIKFHSRLHNQVGGKVMIYPPMPRH